MATKLQRTISIVNGVGMTEISAASSIDKGKTPEQLYQERAKRLDDAIHLRQPDRIPISLAFGNVLAEIGGITRQELYASPDKAQAALEKAALRYQPDIASKRHTLDIRPPAGCWATE